MAILTHGTTHFLIDLGGEQGNAFWLLGYVQSIGKQLGWGSDTIKEISEEMKESDYNHLVKTFVKYCGDYVDLMLPAGCETLDDVC